MPHSPDGLQLGTVTAGCKIVRALIPISIPASHCWLYLAC